MADLEELLQRLTALESDLGDLAIDRLRTAIEDNDQSAAAEEKRISRARRAVAKAVAALSRPE